MTGLGHHPVATRNEIRAQVRSDLHEILYERNKATAIELIQIFRETWRNQEVLLEYLNKNYFGRAAFESHEPQVVDVQKHWMLCYRQDISYASIGTNIKSWHNTLKRHFFRDKQQRRADTVIYVLAVLTIPHFQQKCIRSIVNVGRMNPAQSKELQLTQLATDHIKTRASRGYVGAYLSQTSNLTLRVESFSNSTAGYDIKVDFSRTAIGHITGGSCEYFRNHRSCCKHIALVQMEAPPIPFLCADFWEHEETFQPGMLEPYLHDDLATAAPKVDCLATSIQRLVLMEEMRDKEADFPLKAQMERQMQATLKMFQVMAPRLQGQTLSNKRQRQRRF
ncbi:hypothetical protein EDD11_007887 [Mortierella claussenii]|nr:hypothetical protein EDD11_007887 [Mortierella claussenii]